ncbi:hypothetical protein R80B4_02659 [Fibrobacteres bacterium R8-0-B4]
MGRGEEEPRRFITGRRTVAPGPLLSIPLLSLIRSLLIPTYPTSHGGNDRSASTSKKIGRPPLHPLASSSIYSNNSSITATNCNTSNE